MEKVQEVFKRYEKKYLLTCEQHQALMKQVGDRLILDAYGRHTICNIYFDTDNYELIRASLEKPHYKEKLRLRSYGVPQNCSQVFIELKKKYDGVVYKRRIPVRLEDAERYLYAADSLDAQNFQAEAVRLLQHMDSEQSQIFREIQWFMDFYHPKPSVYLAYDRRAYYGKEQEDFRVTFDENIRYREEQLHLADGDHGIFLLPKNMVLMEVKIPESLPFWFGHILSELEVFPISFSKYGTYYKENLTHLFGEGLLYA